MNSKTFSPVDSGRITRRFTQSIAVPPEAVFPLLCPTRESEWLDGWGDQVELIHSKSGVAEEGCVFRTHVPGRPAATWIVTRHDEREGVVEFVRVTGDLLATRLRIEVRPSGAHSAVHVAYEFTPLGDEGRAFVDEVHSAERFEADLTWWQRAMNHWFATGEMLRRDEAA